MNALVAGANGKTGSLIVKKLIEHDVQVVGLVRKEHQKSSLKAKGAKPLIKDINDPSIQNYLHTIDAIIFAAAGGSGNHQKVDHRGVKNLIEACQSNDTNRFILISALGAHEPNSLGDAYKDYLQAKADGEKELMNSSLEWTIIRPGSLNNNSSKNQVTLNQNAGGMGSISREDVAAVAVACLENENAIGKIFELYDGHTPIKEAVSQL